MALNRWYAARGSFLSSRHNWFRSFAETPAAPAASEGRARGTAKADTAIAPSETTHTKNAAMARSTRPPNFITDILVPKDGRAVWILYEALAVPFGEYFHHPMMEVVHRMIENRVESPVVFFACFVEGGTQ